MVHLVIRYIGTNVALWVLEVLVGKYHHFYFNNYFNSYNLTCVQKKHIYLWNCTAHLPSLLPYKDLKRGDVDWQVSETGILLLKWRDRRTVHYYLIITAQMMLLLYQYVNQMVQLHKVLVSRFEGLQYSHE